MSLFWQEITVGVITAAAVIYLALYLTGWNLRQALASWLLKMGKVSWAMRIRKFRKRDECHSG